jgi:hypothetical protein
MVVHSNDYRRNASAPVSDRAPHTQLRLDDKARGKTRLGLAGCPTPLNKAWLGGVLVVGCRTSSQ